jgi:hypothetical protein
MAQDHFVHETLTGGVDDPHGRIVIFQLAPDGVHQMRFSLTDTAVDEQRVVAARRIAGHRSSSRVGELVAGTNHEVFELEFRIELAAGRCEYRLSQRSWIHSWRSTRGSLTVTRAGNVDDVVNGKFQQVNCGADLLAVFLLNEILGHLVRDGDPQRTILQTFQRSPHDPVVKFLNRDLLRQRRLDLLPGVEASSASNSRSRYVQIPLHVTFSQAPPGSSHTIPTGFPQLWKSTL